MTSGVAVQGSLRGSMLVVDLPAADVHKRSRLRGAIPGALLDIMQPTVKPPSAVSRCDRLVTKRDEPYDNQQLS
ncbi:hypothetical protein PSAC2689_100319 [Paraburkholderia sacchari]